jgi:hypothetical protein
VRILITGARAWCALWARGQPVDSLFVGAYVIDVVTQARGQVVQVLDDGSGLVRLEDGTLVKTALVVRRSGKHDQGAHSRQRLLATRGSSDLTVIHPSETHRG